MVRIPLQPLASVVVAVGITLVAAPALACRCARVDDAAHLAATPVVFTGRVMAGAPEMDGRSFIFKLEVTEAWKGDLPAVVVVLTARSSATCGVSFKPGQSYTVFATPYRQGQFETGSCQLAPFQSRPERFAAMMKKYRARVAAWDRVIAAATDGPKELRAKLDYLLANNDWTTAVSTIDALLDRSPRDKAALLAQRGLLNYRLVRLSAARNDFASALRLDPRLSLADRGLRALDRLEGFLAPARPEAQRSWPESFESSVPP